MSLRPSGILGLVTDGGHGPPEAVAVAPIRVEDRAGLVSGRARQLIEVRQLSAFAGDAAGTVDGRLSRIGRVPTAARVTGL